VRRIGLVLAIAACAKTPTGTLALVVGEESDAFSRAPAPTSLVVEKVDGSGNVSTLTTVALPVPSSGDTPDTPGTVGLPDQTQTDEGAVRVTAKDDSGNVLLRGQSLPVTFGDLAGATLDVFVQRTGEFARMSKGFDDREGAVVAGVVGRYIAIAGGGSATCAIYDLMNLIALPNPPTLPRTPKSIASVGTGLLLVDDQGATAFDLSDSSTGELAAPSGGNFGEIAGGATVVGSDGSQYLVGAARASGAESARILVIDPTGALSFAALATARVGAAAAWVDGRGLVVVGGSASAGTVEVLGKGAASASALGLPPVKAGGLSAAALDGDHVVVVGDATVQVLDLACAPGPQGCVATWAALPSPLVRSDVYAIDPASAFVVGDDASGNTRAFRISASSAVEVTPKMARKGARSLWIPTGSVALVGGADTIEAFSP
jgi:hypothetical protein